MCMSFHVLVPDHAAAMHKLGISHGNSVRGHKEHEMSTSTTSIAGVFLLLSADGSSICEQLVCWPLR
jgi:hypothetical protein